MARDYWPVSDSFPDVGDTVYPYSPAPVLLGKATLEFGYSPV